jgi:hypothetical protein
MRNGVYGSDIPFSESNLVYVHNSDLVGPVQVNAVQKP